MASFDKHWYIYSRRKSEPPNPLRVSPLCSPPRVHFDDGIHFSEQNMRRSCRQLLATLYAGRRADPRGTGRYRSFSMPLERTENTFSASSTKRLSVPVSPPESFITSSTRTSHPFVRFRKHHNSFLLCATGKWHVVIGDVANLIAIEVLSMYSRVKINGVKERKGTNLETTHYAPTRHSTLQTCAKPQRGAGFEPATFELQV